MMVINYYQKLQRMLDVCSCDFVTIKSPATRFLVSQQCCNLKILVARGSYSYIGMQKYRYFDKVCRFFDVDVDVDVEHIASRKLSRCK